MGNGGFSSGRLAEGQRSRAANVPEAEKANLSYKGGCKRAKTQDKAKLGSCVLPKHTRPGEEESLSWEGGRGGPAGAPERRGGLPKETKDPRQTAKKKLPGLGELCPDKKKARTLSGSIRRPPLWECKKGKKVVKNDG